VDKKTRNKGERPYTTTYEERTPHIHRYDEPATETEEKGREENEDKRTKNRERRKNPKKSGDNKSDR
jgi:hypothetical protein